MKAPGRTLISRIVWTTTVVSAIAMAAMIGTVLLVLAALNSNNIDARLNDQLSAVSSTLTAGTDGTLTELDTADDSIDETTWIYGVDGSLLEGPRAGRAVTRVVDELSNTRTRQRIDRFEHAFLAAPVTIEGSLQTVVVVETSLEPYESTRNNVLIGLIALGLTVTTGSAAVAAWTVRRTLAPVESMATRAEDWSEHDLDSRFDVTGSDDEFARLGQTLNILLDRVAGALRNEQQLTSELAHELRTPLTAIRGEAELTMMTDRSPAVVERQERVVQIVDRMSETITSLLAIARGDHRVDGRTSTIDLVAAAVDHAPGGATPPIDVAGVADLEIAAPSELVLRVLAPLIDNARRHASTTVAITASASGRSVRLDVSDDGSGITAAEPDALFQSGIRDEGSDGAGLGLALSRRVARTLGGDVTITSVAGPTTFTMTLPQP
jgi:signal transduction histidine kinase